MPNINLVAQLGLIFFLFIVGMEIDIPYLRKHWKIAGSVGIGSIILPFGLGYAVAIGLYNQFIDSTQHSSSFGVFGLFIAIAISVTALPVLARILTELGLLHDTTGIVVLAAGVSNDIVAWILLALVISLSQSGAPIDTLYILLATIGWFLLFAFLVKPILFKFLKHTGSIDKGPTELAVIVIIILIFVSSFFTDIIGVHSIFGAFIVGAIIPRENSFPARLTEKIEDLISVIFIPIYFAISGFNADLSALNDGVTWGYTILVIVVAFFGKVVGAAIPARLLGLSNGEAIETGILMSCKGLVEIVILNIGLEAKILNTKIFSMFVLMAIVNTFITTPLTLIWRSHIEQRAKRKALHNHHNHSQSNLFDVPKGSDFKLNKVVLAFDNVEMLPSNMIITQMLANPQKIVSLHSGHTDDNENTGSPSHDEIEDTNGALSSQSSFATLNKNYISSPIHKDMFVSAVHLVDLTDRTANLIQAMSGDFIPGNEDPIMKVMTTFTSINRIPFEGSMSIAPHADRIRIIMSLSENPSDLLLVSWDDFKGDIFSNPRLFFKPVSDFSMREGLPTIQAKIALFANLFSEARSHACAFIDRGFSGSSSDSNTIRQVLVPFFGGNDDWLAFGIATYLARDENIHVTVLVSSPTTCLKTEEIPNTKLEVIHSATSQTPPLNAKSPSIFSKFNRTGNTSEQSDIPTPTGANDSSMLKRIKQKKDKKVHKTVHQEEIPLNPIWDSIYSVYETLPMQVQSSISLVKFNLTQEDSVKKSYTQALKCFDLHPHDLVIIGRSTGETDNDFGSNSDFLPSASSSAPMAPSTPDQQSFSFTSPPGMVRALSSGTSISGSNGGPPLFGRVATEIVTAPELSCSFIVCQALHAHIGSAGVSSGTDNNMGNNEPLSDDGIDRSSDEEVGEAETRL